MKALAFARVASRLFKTGGEPHDLKRGAQSVTHFPSPSSGRPHGRPPESMRGSDVQFLRSLLK